MITETQNIIKLLKPGQRIMGIDLGEKTIDCSSQPCF